MCYMWKLHTYFLLHRNTVIWTGGRGQACLQNTLQNPVSAGGCIHSNYSDDIMQQMVLLLFYSWRSGDSEDTFDHIVQQARSPCSSDPKACAPSAQSLGVAFINLGESHLHSFLFPAQLRWGLVPWLLRTYYFRIEQNKVPEMIYRTRSPCFSPCNVWTVG